MKEILSNKKGSVPTGIVKMKRSFWKAAKTFSKPLHILMIIFASVIFGLLLVSSSFSGKRADLKEILTVDSKESKGFVKDGDKLIIDRFSMATEELNKGFFVPKGWHLLRFRGTKRLTHYRPVADGNNVYIRAESDGAAAVIYKIVEFDPREYPFITWKWKAENILEKGNAYSKKGNDFAVSLGIIFDYDPQRASFAKKIKHSFIKLFYGVYPPDYVILYVWGNGVHEKKGDVITSPYSETVKIFVLENGSLHLDEWRVAERNILEDFKEAFGAYPKQKVGGIGIHTDSDNTSLYYKNGYHAVGYYDDIIVTKIPRAEAGNASLARVCPDVS
jgi:hypothetical protein